jgi:RimJ/RimL family protein N-acetyltransferase
VNSTERTLEQWKPAPLPEPVTLTGKWVTLEPLSAAKHGRALWEVIHGHDEIWTWLADGPYVREEELAEALLAKETGTSARFFAILPSDTKYAAGYASLMRIDPANGVIEVGNILLSPSLQRTAAATEAMFLMARYVFESLGYRRYEWKCNAHNLPSRRAAERFGFVFEGVFRQHMVVKGQNRDTAWFSMLDAEWPVRKRAFEAWLAPENFDSEGRQKRRLGDLTSTEK